jgi:GT2 family glycosyltransferase
VVENSSDSQYALVLCTINRSDLVGILLNDLAKQTHKPNCVVVVDSSDDDLTCKVVNDTVAPFHIHYAHSMKGLPHQRNVGVYTLEKNCGLKPFKFVGFLDDDVSVSETYFENTIIAFEDNPSAVLVGGFDKNLVVRESTFLQRVLNLNSQKMGHVMKSGLVTYVHPVKNYESVTWVPGHSFNIRTDAFNSVRFRGEARIHGEDVEMQLRLSRLGSIIVPKDLAVDHHRSPVYRDSHRNDVAYNDGFRYWLSKNYPEICSTSWVLMSTFALSVRALLFAFTKHDRMQKLAFLGHLDFFKRLISGKELEQLVDHKEWQLFQTLNPIDK